MFFLFALSPIFICIYFYIKYNKKNEYNKSLRFNNSDIDLNDEHWLILSIEQYNNEYDFLQEIIVDKPCTVNMKEIIDLEKYNMGNDINYNVINYLYKDQFFKIVIDKYEYGEQLIINRDTMIYFPVIDEIKKYIYVNKINKVILFINHTKNTLDTTLNTSSNSPDNENNIVIDITKVILKYIGPNYNFYSETEFKQKISTILLIEKIISTKNDNFFINIYDNFDNKIKLTNYLDWNPSII